MSDDRTALEELLAASIPEAVHTFSHYLYLPTETAAIDVADRLRDLDYKTVERLGADGVSWLVLARQHVVPSEEAIATARRLMEELTQSHQGEYDGWEAEVQR